MRRSKWLPACLPLLLCAAALAQVPAKLGYQGRLYGADGAPVSGLVKITFALYAAKEGGAPLWTEEQTLALTRGFYATALGEVVPLPPAAVDGPERWLQLSIGSEVLVPRQRLTAVPYALRAERAAVAGVAERFAGGPIAGGLAVQGDLSVDGKVRLGAGGHPLTALKRLQVSWDPPSTPNTERRTHQVTLSEPGAVVIGVRPPPIYCGQGYGCFYTGGAPSVINGPGGLQYSGGADNTVKVELSFANATGATVDPGPGIWTLLYIVP